MRTRLHAANASTNVHKKCNKVRLRGTTVVNNDRYSGGCQGLNSQPQICLSFTHMVKQSTGIRVEPVLEEI